MRLFGSRPFKRCGVLGVVCLACMIAMQGWCQATHPVAYTGLSSSQFLQANPQDSTGHLPYVYYAPDTNLASYRAAIFEPVTVYQGADAQLSGLTPEHVQELATYMQAQFQQALAPRFYPATAVGPTVLRLHITLTGASRSVPGLSTASQVVPVGAVLGAIRGAHDKSRKTLGSVSYAVEVYDSSTNRLLRAFVVYEYPRPEDVRASVGPLGSSEASVRRGASLLVSQLQ
jgi:hypothetical protein